MTQSQIKEHLLEIYEVEVSKELISTITDTVMDDVRAWQNRQLAGVYPIVYLDAVVVKGRVGKQVIRRAVSYTHLWRAAYRGDRWPERH